MANFGAGKKGKGGGGSANNLPAVPGIAEIQHMRCKVCKSPYRREIDSLLATGWSQAMVIRHFNPMIEDEASKFTPQNMSNHAKQHLTSRDAAVRKIYEERARQMGVDVENAENFIVTRAAALDALIHQGLQGVYAGSTNVEAKDIITAIDKLDKMEAEWKETAIDEIMTEFKLFMEAVKEVVGEEPYSDIYESFERKLSGRNLPVLSPAPADVVEKKAEHYREQFEVIEDAELADDED